MSTGPSWTQSSNTSDLSKSINKPADLRSDSEEGNLQTSKLTQVLQSYNLIETEEGTQQKFTVLGHLNKIVTAWIGDCCRNQGIHQFQTCGAIYTYGSFRLGVHTPDSDIDTLCVAPSNIDRDRDFFGTLFQILQTNTDVTELSAVTGAFVPIITFRYQTVPIDLIFAQLPLQYIINLNKDKNKTTTLELSDLDDSVLNSIDNKSMLSLNGCRNTDMILKLVPNRDSFRTALRTIKLWAKRRGIYSNKLGFLGGISWAIMTANICQYFPNLSAFSIISVFFLFYDRWEWPRAVHLNEVVTKQLSTFKVWNKKLSKDLMPIITPAYPAQNSTYNVSKSTLYHMRREFSRSLAIIQSIESNDSQYTWEDFFEPHQFFSDFNCYLEISISAPNEDDLRKLADLVESKVRILILELEKVPPLEYAVPNSDRINSTTEQGAPSVHFFLGLVVSRQPDALTKDLDLRAAAENFKLLLKEPSIKISSHKRKTLPNYCFPNGRKRKRRAGPNRRAKRARISTDAPASLSSAATDTAADPVQANPISDTATDPATTTTASATTTPTEAPSEAASADAPAVVEPAPPVEVPKAPELYEIGSGEDVDAGFAQPVEPVNRSMTVNLFSIADRTG